MGGRERCVLVVVVCLYRLGRGCVVGKDWAADGIGHGQESDVVADLCVYLVGWWLQSEVVV